MPKRHKMEIKFDGILKQAVPLILFSYEKYRKPLLEKVSKLYEAFDANNTDIFDELFSQLSDMIDNREMLDSNRERLIESFINRDKTYDERLVDHDNRLMKLTKEVSLLRKKKGKPRSIKKKTPKRRKTLLKKKCPYCGSGLGKYGKTEKGFQKYHCNRKNNGCGKTFAVDRNGNFIKCDECGAVMRGYGETRTCVKCGAKKTI